MEHNEFRILSLNTIADGVEYRIYGRRPSDLNWELVDVFGTKEELNHAVSQLVSQGYLVYDLGGYAVS